MVARAGVEALKTSGWFSRKPAKPYRTIPLCFLGARALVVRAPRISCFWLPGRLYVVAAVVVAPRGQPGISCIQKVPSNTQEQHTHSLPPKKTLASSSLVFQNRPFGPGGPSPLHLVLPILWVCWLKFPTTSRAATSSWGLQCHMFFPTQKKEPKNYDRSVVELWWPSELRPNFRIVVGRHLQVIPILQDLLGQQRETSEERGFSGHFGGPGNF